MTHAHEDDDRDREAREDGAEGASGAKDTPPPKPDDDDGSPPATPTSTPASTPEPAPAATAAATARVGGDRHLAARGRRGGLVGAPAGAAAAPHRPAAAGPRRRSRSTARHARALGALAPAARRRGRQPARIDSLAHDLVGYAVNNMLPARAGDAVARVLMAPRAGAVACGPWSARCRRAAPRRRRDRRPLPRRRLRPARQGRRRPAPGSSPATVVAWGRGAVAVALVRRTQRIHDFVAPIAVVHAAPAPPPRAALLAA